MEFIDRPSIVLAKGDGRRYCPAESTLSNLLHGDLPRDASDTSGVEVTSPEGVIIASPTRPSVPTHQLLLR